MNILNKNIYDDFLPWPFDDQGWGGKDPIFKELIKEINPKLIIEVGTWKGQSAITMGESINELNLDCKIICVDTWLGAIEFWTHYKDDSDRSLKLKNGYPQIYYQFLSNVIHKNLQNIILPFPNTSSTAAKYFSINKIKADLIYIDASHEEDDVYNDIKNYFNLLNPNGIIFGDDWKIWNGVTNAVERFSEENKLNLSINNRFWIIKNEISDKFE